MATAADNSMPALDGLRSLVLENRLLRAVVLPELGGRIWQITYKPLSADLLWHSPAAQPVPQSPGASYDDVWCGGWDELYPNDEAATLDGMTLPDHGELWTGNWDAVLLDSRSAWLAFKTPITQFSVEKNVRLCGERAQLEVTYRLTNESARPVPFLFKLHPAFAVSAAHRLDFAPMTVEPEPDCLGSLEGAPAHFAWPVAPLPNGPMDLRHVPDVSQRALHFFYGSGFRDGWCGVTNTETQLAAALRFDSAVFSSCWLFATHGGWRDLNVAVMEPATGYPFRMQTMIDRGRARWLKPGERLETSVLLSVQEGLTSVGGVDEDGRIYPNEEA